MKLEIINGIYSKGEALELISEIILTKIKFHEKKISLSDQPEDIQFRERKIKKLSETLRELRLETSLSERLNVEGFINIIDELK